MSRFEHLEKFILNFSSLPFVICANLLHPGFFIVCQCLSVFSLLVPYYFQVFFNLKVILYVAIINSKWLQLSSIMYRWQRLLVINRKFQRCHEYWVVKVTIQDIIKRHHTVVVECFIAKVHCVYILRRKRSKD